MSRPIRREFDSNGKLKPYNRCRKWELQVSITENGKSRKRSKRFQGTYREACDELARFRVQVENEKPSSTMSLRKYTNAWMEKRMESGDFSANTLRSNSVCINRMEDWLLDKGIGDITFEDIDSYISALSVQLAANTVAMHWKVLSGIFKTAMKEGLIHTSPMLLATPPKRSATKRKTPTMQEIQKIVSHFDIEQRGYEMVIILLAYTGMRRSECTGLTWADVRDGGLNVDKQEGGLPTKTRKNRFIPLPAWLYEKLDGMRGEPDEQVVSKCGINIKANALNSWWYSNRDKFDAKDVKLHDFRHAYITALAESGAPVAVTQSIAGHTKSATTLEVYTHVHDDAAKAAVDECFGERFAADLRQLA